MLITRTPYRISFFGGGTDYPAWFREHGGTVLSTTIDRACYLACHPLPPFFAHRYRVVYSRVEEVVRIDDISHPSVRACLRFLRLSHGLEIHHTGELPARSGMGSSSAFTVGLLHALCALRGTTVQPARLMRDAIHVEQELIGEAVGCQDQVAAACGGFNLIRFRRDGRIRVRPAPVPAAVIRRLEQHLLLFHTGVSRNAPQLAREQLRALPQHQRELHALQALVPDALAALQSSDLNTFGSLLHESWQIKRTLSSAIAPPFIDDIYAAARRAGAAGGKLLGAGGGGFMLCCAPPARHARIRAALRRLPYVPVRFSSDGSRVVHASRTGAP